jgi:hypothetical protein
MVSSLLGCGRIPTVAYLLVELMDDMLVTMLRRDEEIFMVRAVFCAALINGVFATW